MLVVLARLPFLARPLSRDEAGFLLLARDWLSPTSTAADSLYGQYWVDRPPGLLFLFRLGDLLGGTVGLRVLGAIAAALVVLFAARAARSVAGPRAYAATAVVAAVLLACPLNGTSIVDGELLAAPFVAGALWAWCSVREQGSVPRSLLAGCLAGAAAAAAVLVKQNTIDAFVVIAVIELVRGLRLSRARLAGWAGLVAGAGLMTSVVLAVTVAHGTTLSGLYDAMLPFRIEARGVAVDSAGTARRAQALALYAVIGGLVPFVVYAAWRLRRLPHRAVVLGLTVVLAYDVVSVLFGGGYWSHYLVQPIVPVSLLVGLAVAPDQSEPAADEGRWSWLRPWVVIAAGVAVIAASVNVGLLAKAPRAPGVAIGAAIARAAEPGDTIVTLYGDPSIVEAAGLASPYPYLWSLPIRVRDPHLRLVKETLTGPEAPTWIVVTRRVGVWNTDPTDLERVLRDHYQWMRSACGMKIFLRADVERPLGGVNCRDPFTAPAS